MAGRVSDVGGRVLITFDCEGRWGMADHLTSADRSLITTANLVDTYDRLVDTLDAADVPATFAFVALFATPVDLVAERLDELDRSEATRRWSAAIVADLRAGRTDGWDGAALCERVRSSGRHEIASHGYSHLPWNYPGITENDRVAEADGIARWRTAMGFDEVTLVYPRNQVAATDLLAPRGVTAYRLAPALRTGSPAARALNLVDEFRPARAEPMPSVSSQGGVAGQAVALPAGVPINWRSGPRRRVPIGTSRRRMAAMLDDAVRNDRIAHLWIHPHNFITGDRQYELFALLLDDIARRREADGLQVVTQRDLAAPAR